jgi:predicted RNase H-like HicB family nuclease
VKDFDIVHEGITYHFEKDPAGGYCATVPDLPGCISEGATLDQAFDMIREALALYVEASIEELLPLPERYHQLASKAS